MDILKSLKSSRSITLKLPSPIQLTTDPGFVDSVQTHQTRGLRWAHCWIKKPWALFVEKSCLDCRWLHCIYIYIYSDILFSAGYCFLIRTPVICNNYSPCVMFQVMMYQQCTIIWTDVASWGIFGELKKWFKYIQIQIVRGKAHRWSFSPGNCKANMVGLGCSCALPWIGKGLFPMKIQHPRTFENAGPCLSLQRKPWEACVDTSSQCSLSAKETEEAVDRDVITFSSEVPADPVRSYLFGIVFMELVYSPSSYFNAHWFTF